MECIPNHVAT